MPLERCRILLDASGRPSLAGTAELEARLAEKLTAARTRWPGVALAADVFLRFLGSRSAPFPSPEDALDALLCDELFLCCACGHGDPRALEHLDREFILPLLPVLAKIGSETVSADELAQQLRERLLVQGARAVPKLLQYSGSGELRSWLRVVATRVALNLRGASSREELASDTEVFERAVTAADPEVTAIQQSSEGLFKAALARAAAALSTRDRRVLRLQYLEGLTVDEIGQRCDVHPVTASRWLAAARKSLALRLKVELQANAGPAETVKSLLRGLHSRVELSLPRVLADGESNTSRGEG